RKLKELARALVANEKGLETVEYAIIVGIIVAGTIGLMPLIGGWVNTKFTQLDTGLSSTNPPAALSSSADPGDARGNGRGNRGRGRGGANPGRGKGGANHKSPTPPGHGTLSGGRGPTGRGR
ncbi:hypothetical protein LCGC14_1703820, partial [marine sediment metagenome]